MSDIRGIPRRSKTAIVVVLVVFLQMLALAVVGMGAIKEDRVRGREQRLAQNDDEARLELTALRERIARDVDRELDKALLAGTWQDAEKHKELMPFLFRCVERPDSITWFDGQFELWRRDEDKRVQLMRDKKHQKTWRPLYERIRAGTGTPRMQFDALVDGYAGRPLLLLQTSSEFDPYHPLAPSWADRVFEPGGLFEQVLPEFDHSSDLRRPVLAALSTYALNVGRPEIGPVGDITVGRVREHVLAQVRRIPDRLKGGIEGQVTAFLAHVDFLRDADRERQLRSFYAAGRKYFREGPGVRAFVEGAGATELFAMLPESGGGTYRVGLIDKRTLGRLVSELAQAAELTFRRLGMQIRLETDPQTTDTAAEDLLERVPVEVSGMRLPFELQRFKGADVVGDVEGRSEVWYLLIMALAVLGLLFGGLILFRLWRREVRLAQLKADFVSNLSHELKTPLTSISLFTEMLRDGKLDDAPEDRREAFEVLDQEAQRLQRIVSRMIETARNETQGVPHNLMVGDLNRPILEAVNRFQRIVTEPGLDLRIQLAPEPLPMLLDPSAMDDAVTNLLSNAWKYKRGDAAHIEVETTRRGRHAEVIVTDDGIGIPRSERKRVFETFYRAEQFLTQPVQGTGLGLALVRTIVRAHKGRIRMETSPSGQGTRFRLRFPLGRKAAAIWAARPPESDHNDAPSRAPEAHESVENTGATA